jgi:hypothetical protein
VDDPGKTKKSQFTRQDRSQSAGFAQRDESYRHMFAMATFPLAKQLILKRRKCAYGRVVEGFLNVIVLAQAMHAD